MNPTQLAMQEGDDSKAVTQNTQKILAQALLLYDQPLGQVQ
jgi:hypothetical protein